MNKFKKFIFVVAMLTAFTFSLTACDLFFYPIDDGTHGSIIQEGSSYTVEIKSGSSTLPYTSLVEMLQNIRKTSVEVYATHSGSKTFSCGSGIIMGETKNGEDVTSYYVLTCHHVIAEESIFTVKDINGTEFVAKLMGGDEVSDIAVLQIDLTDLNNSGKNIDVAVGEFRGIDVSGDLVTVGEEVVAIGNPLGTLGGTVTRGIVSTVARDITVEGKTMTLIQTDCAINPGNSGGGLFGMDGRLVGVVNAGYSGEVEGLNFAIPATTALSVYVELIETCTGGSYGYGYVEGRGNILVEEYSELTGKEIDFSVETVYVYPYYQFRDVVYANGVKVKTVNENSPFYGKLKVGDKILAVKCGDYTYDAVTTATGLISFFESVNFNKGDEVIFSVSDGTAVRTETVTLGQYVYTPPTK